MPCVAGLARRQDDTPGTGCRPDCLHRAKVQAYRDLKAAEAEVRKLAREAVAGATKPGSAEREEWEAAHPQLTFQQYLDDTKQPRSTAA